MALCLTALAGIAISGCAGHSAARADSRTGGVELTLSVRDETGAEEYYEVDRDGTFGWGGGVKARFSSVTWTDRLSDDELQQLKEFLAAADWFREKPIATHEPPEFRYRMSINAPESRRTFTVWGDHPRLAPIRKLLANASLRRLRPDLEKLPLPSSQQEP